MTEEELYAWWFRDWRGDAKNYELPPDPPEPDTLDMLEEMLEADDGTWTNWVDEILGGE